MSAAAAEGQRILVAGNANVDVLLGPVDVWPQRGTEVVTERFEWRVGGMLGNAALALAGFGVPATLVWDVGDDAMGRWLAEALAAAGDAPRILRASTSVTVGITHGDGERTFFSHLGHLAASDHAKLREAIDGARTGDHLLVGGSFLLPRWRRALPDLLARARERGLVSALDTGWPTEGWTDEVRAEVTALLAHVDLYLPNLEEARGLTGEASAAPERLLDALSAHGPGTTVLKLGRDGAALRDGGRFAHVRAPAVEVRDTVGAGDTFDAALIVARMSGTHWRESTAIAVRAASAAIATSPRRYPAWSALQGVGAP
ncbi:PfkB family carbohydrate kinase [soil metagenome]